MENKKNVRHYTLSIIVQQKSILLGKKKRGFGKDYWNGFGGKIEPNETLDHAFDREVLEECGLIVEEKEKVAELFFTFENDPQLMYCHVFMVHKFSGEMQETEEMLPKWFAYENIPYSNMWEDDELWLPKVLDGEKLQGTFHFSEENKMLSNKIALVSKNYFVEKDKKSNLA